MNSVALIIPSFCPPSSLPQLCQALRSKGFAKIYVVNDGSPQSFEPIFESLEHDGHVVFSSYANLGKGGAIKFGLSKILELKPECTHIMFCDDDGQHDPLDVATVAFESANKGHKFSIGIRTFNKSTPWKSLLGNRFMTFFLRTWYQIDAPDSQSGLRCFSRDVVDHLLKIPDDGFGFELQTILRFKKLGINFHAIPVKTIYFNKNRHTRFNPFSDSYKVVKSALGLKP